MILDTSVVLAIVLGEEGYEELARVVMTAGTCRLSAASLLEASIVAEFRMGDGGIRLLDSFLEKASVQIEPVTASQAYRARQCYSDYGKGRHRASLNFGDCFSYALAKSFGEPLYYKGEDFQQTDVAAVV